MCFFYPSAFFSLPVAGRSSCSRAPWHAGSPPGPRAQVWALAEVRGTCSGDSKWQVPTGRDSEHVEPSRPLQTHVQVKECPTAHVISGMLNVINVVRHYLLGDAKVFPRHQHARHATTFSTRCRIWSLLTHMTTRWLGLFTCDPRLYEYTINI